METWNYDCTLGFIFSEDKNNILLIKKEKPDWQKGKLNGIGGKMEDFEKMFATMHRETLEELGIIVEWDKFLTVTDNEQRILHVFRSFSDIIFDLDSQKNDAGEKIFVFDFYKFNQIRDKCMYNIHWMVNMALDKSIKNAIVSVTSLKK